MAEKLVLDKSIMTGIGDAIRAKAGTSELIPSVEMAQRITDLPSGGGSGGGIKTNMAFPIELKKGTVFYPKTFQVKRNQYYSVSIAEALPIAVNTLLIINNSNEIRIMKVSGTDGTVLESKYLGSINSFTDRPLLKKEGDNLYYIVSGNGSGNLTLYKIYLTPDFTLEKPIETDTISNSSGKVYYRYNILCSKRWIVFHTYGDYSFQLRIYDVELKKLHIIQLSANMYNSSGEFKFVIYNSGTENYFIGTSHSSGNNTDYYLIRRLSDDKQLESGSAKIRNFPVGISEDGYVLFSDQYDVQGPITQGYNRSDYYGCSNWPEALLPSVTGVDKSTVYKSSYLASEYVPTFNSMSTIERTKFSSIKKGKIFSLNEFYEGITFSSKPLGPSLNSLTLYNFSLYIDQYEYFVNHTNYEPVIYVINPNSGENPSYSYYALPVIKDFKPGEFIEF